MRVVNAKGGDRFRSVFNPLRSAWREGGWIAGRVILCRSPPAAPPYVHRPMPSRGPATAHHEAGGGHACGRRQDWPSPLLKKRVPPLWVGHSWLLAGGRGGEQTEAGERGRCKLRARCTRNNSYCGPAGAELSKSSCGGVCGGCASGGSQRSASVQNRCFPPHPPGRLGDASGREGVNRMDRGVPEQGLPLLQDESMIRVTVVGG